MVEIAKPRLYIRIPAKAWKEHYATATTSCASPLCHDHNVVSKPTQLTPVPHLKLKLTAPPKSKPRDAKNQSKRPNRLAHQTETESEEDVPWPSRRCKTPLYRFHPPGLNQATRGPHMNDVTLEAPCLQRTCKSCATWHPQWIEEPVPRPIVQGMSRPAVQPLSPAIDPRILGLWMGCEEKLEDTYKDKDERRGSDISTLELPEPIFPALRHVHVQDATPSPLPLPTSYAVLLPTSLLTHLAGSTSATSHWRVTPRHRYTAVLKTRSKEGRRRIEDIIARSPRKRGILKVVEGNQRAGKKVRFRHRVRLAFRGDETKGRFAELVKGW